MVCTEGMPRTASHLLLGALARAGARLRFHVDFDWAGVRIGNLLSARHGAFPWRMGVSDYQEGPAGPRLGDGSILAVWDAGLSPAMAARGVAVHEESVLGALLEGLRTAGTAG
jgi:uncharacterized protein (TIGR02679 family)